MGPIYNKKWHLNIFKIELNLFRRRKWSKIISGKRPSIYTIFCQYAYFFTVWPLFFRNSVTFSRAFSLRSHFGPNYASQPDPKMTIFSIFLIILLNYFVINYFKLFHFFWFFYQLILKFFNYFLIFQFIFNFSILPYD